MDKYTAITTLKNRLISGTPKETLALDLFRFQYEYNPVYHRWCTLLGIRGADVTSLHQIPYLPVQCFKHFDVTSRPLDKPVFEFKSSGTTTQAIRSKTLVYDPQWYHNIALKLFDLWFSTLSEPKCRFFSLLPGYTGRPDSSLLFMVEHLSPHFSDATCVVFDGDYDCFHGMLLSSAEQGFLPVVWAVSHALLHWIRQPSAIKVRNTPMLILETGGMKGLEKEIVRKQLHSIVQEVFTNATIRSEYGMTELCSQAYTNASDRFQTPDTMYVRARMINDPYTVCKSNTAGLLQITDLANVETCAFIELEDIGIVYDDTTFDVLGRLDQAESRGCNLLMS